MPELQFVAPSLLQPPPFNTRTSFDDEKMAGLVESIREGGIHEPIIGRRVNGHIEVVAGERRRRAAQAAKVETVPVLIREMSDAEALVIQLTENEQREDVSALDQAAGFRRLMELQPETYTAEKIAQTIGLKPGSVYLRLKLLAMIDPAKELFRAGNIEAGHAVLIARLEARDQEKAVKWLKDWQKSRPDNERASVRDLKRWIAANVKIDLFGPQLAEEQPKVAARLQKLKDKGIEVVQVSRSYLQHDDAKKAGVVPAGEFREAKKKCKSTQPGAVVYGEEAELLDVCIDKGCKVHFPELQHAKRAAKSAAAKKTESPAAKAKRVAAEAAERQRKAIEEELRGVVLTQILSTTKAISRPVLQRLVSGALDASGSLEYSEELEALGLLKLTKGYTRDGSHLKAATERQLAQLAVFATLEDRLHYEFPKVAKEFGVDLKALLTKAQTAAGEPAAAKKATARKKR